MYVVDDPAIDTLPDPIYGLLFPSNVAVSVPDVEQVPDAIVIVLAFLKSYDFEYELGEALAPEIVPVAVPQAPYSVDPLCVTLKDQDVPLLVSVKV